MGRRTLVVAAVVAGLVAASAIGRQTASDTGPTPKQTASSIQAVVDKSLAEAAKAPAHSVVAYNVIGPSLVLIQIAAAGDGSERSGGLGTGVVINADGEILTAAHVIAGGGQITVTFADGTRAPAKVVSSEPTKDIAVLLAENQPEVLVPAVMGGGLKVGDEVFAVGHPFGLVGSLSSGVVSGFGRSIPIKDGQRLEDLIQFDAAVNPGNSGGPLLNRNGQVVGVVTALANPSEQAFFVGIGFAVPIATAGGAAGGPSL